MTNSIRPYRLASLRSTGEADANGKPTQKYLIAQPINHYVEQIIGPAVMASTSLGAFHTSVQPTMESLPAEPLISNPQRPLIGNVSDLNVLVGVFDGTDAQYGLVVNKKTDQINDISVTLKCDCRGRIQLAPSVVNSRVKRRINQWTSKTSSMIRS